MSGVQSKHAYLMIAHTNFEQLQILIDLLDDPRNDIYLHIDKKSKNVPVFSTKHSKLYLIKPMNVVWGGHSQVHCEMKLMEAAAKEHYRYYHLISGMDLPLKTQDEIHGFFREHDGKEFMELHGHTCRPEEFQDRILRYYFLGNLGFNTRTHFGYGLRLIDQALAKLQKFLHISRKTIFPLYKSHQWFSITDNMVQYVLSQKKAIRKQFDYTLCADESFMYGVAMSSPLRENVVNNMMRAIDWDRGLPYTYRKEDVPMLLASEKLWGRKFDQRIDKEAIEMIAAHLCGKAD